MSKLKALTKPVDKDLITLLENALEQVRSGDVTGIVILMGRTCNEYNFASAGDMAMSEVVNAFNSWEFDQRLSAHLELMKK